MQNEIWPPKPLRAPLENAQQSPKPGGSVYLLAPGVVVGVGLYVLTIFGVISYALHSTFGSVPLGRMGILAMLFLCNIVPAGIFLRCRQRLFYLARGIISGSLFASFLLILYTLRMWFLPFPHSV